MFAVTSERKGMGQTEGGEAKKKNKMLGREEAVKGGDSIGEIWCMQRNVCTLQNFNRKKEKEV